MEEDFVIDIDPQVIDLLSTYVMKNDIPEFQKVLLSLGELQDFYLKGSNYSLMYIFNFFLSNISVV